MLLSFLHFLACKLQSLVQGKWMVVLVDYAAVLSFRSCFVFLLPGHGKFYCSPSFYLNNVQVTVRRSADRSQ